MGSFYMRHIWCHTQQQSQQSHTLPWLVNYKVVPISYANYPIKPRQLSALKRLPANVAFSNVPWKLVLNGRKMLGLLPEMRHVKA
ncbi:unnamed protein product, partial [Dovyalis caffra]